jgi:hypothetical protein
MFTMTEREYQEWFTETQAAIGPCVEWESMIHTHQGRHIRITRSDFPDSSSAIANETWYKLHQGECDVSAYQYCLFWAALPIQ